MAGHAGDGVVHDDHRCVRLVVGHVHQTGDAGVHEGGVANDGNGLIVRCTVLGFGEAVKTGNGSAHADNGIHSLQGSNGAQGVTADITQNGDFILFQGVEQTTVGASGTHDRRAGRNGCIQSSTDFPRSAELLRHSEGEQFINIGKCVLSDTVKAKILAMCLNKAV